jgi:hypothetical protein
MNIAWWHKFSAPTGFGSPGDVLAQQVKLELPVNQWFLRAVAACFGRFAAVTIPCRHRKLSSAWGCRPRAHELRGHDLDFRDKCLPLAPAQAQRITPRLGCPGRTLATLPWQIRGSVPLDAWSHGRPCRWAGRLPPRSCRRFRCYSCSCATWHHPGPRPWCTSLVLRQVVGAAGQEASGVFGSQSHGSQVVEHESIASDVVWEFEI